MNKEFLWTIVVLTIALMFCLAQDAKAAVAYDNMDSSFETIVKGTDLQKIETWEQPRTQYTPKNLRTQYQIRFNGKTDTGVGSYTMPVTDYDTKIIKSLKATDGYYYIQDNTGAYYKTGEAVNLQPINDKINNLQNRLQDQDSRINKLDNKIESGLATVTALTSLHPNPTSNEKLEVSIGAGMYADNVAGAVGVFYHPNNRVQIYAGGSYGGEDQFAGGIGVTFGLGRRK